MKSLLNFSKYVAVLAGGIILLNSCDKVKTPDPMGDAGQTLVKIIGGGNPAAIAKNPVDFVPTPTTIVVADVRRDVANNAELNRLMHVTVKDDTAAVRAANPNYIILPDNWYTIGASTPKTGASGGVFNLVLNPGEFAKPISITIPDATVLDPSSLYALGFTITSVDADGKIADSRSVVVEIGAKNDYDGSYAVTGPVVDAVAPTLVQWANQNGYTDPFLVAHPGSWELHLITTGATQCNALDNTVWGDFYHPLFQAPSSNTGYGTFSLVVNFNAATGSISDVYNLWGTTAYGGGGAPNYAAPNTRRAVLDPTGVNAVQGNRDILIKYFMLQPSLVAPPSIRTTFNEKWEYVGPR